MWIFEYRDLIQVLTISNLKIKYQSSVLGFAWSLINPLFMMIILYIVFSGIFKISEKQFALYILIGIVTWRFFTSATNLGMISIVSQPGLVKKIFFPREILVFSSVLSCLISSLLEFAVLFCILIILQVSISSSILLFPIIILIFFGIAYAFSLGLSSLFVYYRDLNQIWDVLLQAGFFLCPIVYPITVIPEKYLALYMLNPLTVIMEIFRDILLNGIFPPLWDVMYISLWGLFLLIIGHYLFSRLKIRFAEEV